MLILKKNWEAIRRVLEGSSFTVDGIYVSPAVAGWSYGPYSLEVEPVVPPPVPQPPTKRELLDYAADLRWQREVGGIMVGDMFVATDDRSKLLLQGARTAADADPDHVEGWKTSSGAWVDLDATTIVALSNAVRAHVSSCFALERSVAAQIEAEVITTLAEIELAFG